MRCCQLVRCGLKFLVQCSVFSSVCSLLNRPTDRLQMTLECGPLKIVAKYDLLIGTWRTAIWHSKKSNFAVSSTDCSFKHFAVLSKIACMSTELRCLDPD